MTMLSSVECEPGGTEGVSQLVELGKSDTVMHSSVMHSYAQSAIIEPPKVSSIIVVR